MNLYEAFASFESRKQKVILFVDMSDSTAMKEQHPEATWLTTLGWFYDRVGQIVTDQNGRIVKYLGDGVMAMFEPDNAAEAVNAAIGIQEAIIAAYETVRFNCTVGIAAGMVVEFNTPGGDADYVGTVVDRAARLSGDASPKAVLVDKAVVNMAQMQKVASRVGAALSPPRQVEDYTGDLQDIRLRGFSQPVPYYEIKWDTQEYGIKSKAITEAIKADQANSPGKTHEKIVSGEVQRWDVDKGHGFITRDGEYYYSDKRYVVNGLDLQVGERVYFVERDPLVEGKNSLAACVVAVNREYVGRIVNVVGTKGICFVQLADAQSNSFNVYLAFSDLTEGKAELGGFVQLVLGENVKGPVGKQAQHVT